jgi:hypothetical protein
MPMTGPGGDFFNADVFVCENDPQLLEHEFERRVLTYGGELRKTGGQYVIRYVSRNKDGDGALWSTGKGVYVSVVAGRYPEEVIEAYLKKHPSALTKDYRVDEGKWLEAEIGYRFRWMDDALAMDDHEQGRRRFSQQVTLFREDFVLPITEETCRSFDGCREAKELLAAWWEANKSKLRWNRKTKKFEVKE